MTPPSRRRYNLWTMTPEEIQNYFARCETRLLAVVVLALVVMVIAVWWVRP